MGQAASLQACSSTPAPLQAPPCDFHEANLSGACGWHGIQWCLTWTTRTGFGWNAFYLFKLKSFTFYDCIKDSWALRPYSQKVGGLTLARGFVRVSVYVSVCEELSQFPRVHVASHPHAVTVRERHACHPNCSNQYVCIACICEWLLIVSVALRGNPVFTRRHLGLTPAASVLEIRWLEKIDS